MKHGIKRASLGLAGLFFLSASAGYATKLEWSKPSIYNVDKGLGAVVFGTLGVCGVGAACRRKKS